MLFRVNSGLNPGFGVLRSGLRGEILIGHTNLAFNLSTGLGSVEPCKVLPKEISIVEPCMKKKVSTLLR
jgi:hypothetical protein